MVTQITSAKNPKVKHAYALRERRERDREGVTILEGYRELSRALALGIRIRECFCCPELYLGENENKLIADIEHSGAEIYETTKEILIKLAYRDRPEGSESKLNTYSDGFKVLFTIFKLYRDYKPFGFFSILALILGILAVIFFIPVLAEYVKTGLVLKFPTLIVCGFVGLAAIQSFFAGLILSNMAMKNRRDFEYRYTLVCEKGRRMSGENK